MTFVNYGMRREQEAAFGLATSVLFAIPERDGIVVTPSAATVSIYRPGESTPTISAAAATVDGTTHLMTYAPDFSNTSTWVLGLLVLAEFSVTVASGAPFVIRQMVRLVRVPMTHVPPCNVNDLVRAHVSVQDALDQAGITDPERWIAEAWEEILQWCETNGKIPGYITNPGVLAPMLRNRARALMFRALSREDDDNYSKNMSRCQKEYEKALLNPGVIAYDAADARAPDEENGWTQPMITLSGRNRGDRNALRPPRLG